jgi:hypothetical protein
MINKELKNTGSPDEWDERNKIFDPLNLAVGTA